MVCGNFRIEIPAIFADKECLLEALDKCSIKYTVETDRIVLIDNKNNILNGSVFNLVNGVYTYTYNKPSYYGNRFYEQTIKADMIARIEKEYNNSYKFKQERLEQMRIEEELKRQRELEEERRRKYVETKVKDIMEKGKSKGFYIKKTENGKQVQLVLTKTVY